MGKGFWNNATALGALAAALAGTACGYRVAGQATRLPPDVKVIAIPAFENKTPWMRLEQRLTAAVMREFLQRTRYEVAGDPEQADAVLRGTVLSATSAPVIFDPATGRASAVTVEVSVDVELRDRRTQKVLYADKDWIFREQYEITSDLDSFFEERDPALERLARDFAASLVSAVVESF